MVKKTEVVKKLTELWGPGFEDESSQARLTVLLETVQADEALVAQVRGWVPRRADRPSVGSGFQAKCLALGMLLADHGYVDPALPGGGFEAVRVRCRNFESDLGGWERTVKQTPQGRRQPLMDLLARDLREVGADEFPFYGLATMTLGLIAVERSR